MLARITIVFAGIVSASAAAPPDQVAAATALIARITGRARGAAFNLSLSPAVGADQRDTFTVAEGPCCSITGTSGVALASGFNWYLRYIAKRYVLYGHP